VGDPRGATLDVVEQVLNCRSFERHHIGGWVR
jgi:hypothetical protein